MNWGGLVFSRQSFGLDSEVVCSVALRAHEETAGTILSQDARPRLFIPAHHARAIFCITYTFFTATGRM